MFFDDDDDDDDQLYAVGVPVMWNNRAQHNSCFETAHSLH